MNQINPRSSLRVGVAGPSRWRGCSGSASQTLALGRAIASLARGDDLIALVGELGAGKTQLVRGLVQGLGIDPGRVSSPTFVLMQQYTRADGGLAVWHIDAYRLGHGDDGESIGWGSDLFGNAVTVIEWADRLAGPLPADRLDIELLHAGVDQRHVAVKAWGSWRDRMGRLCLAWDGVVAGSNV